MQVFASGPNSFYNKSVKTAATVCFVVPVKITQEIIWIFILGSLLFSALELTVVGAKGSEVSRVLNKAMFIHSS